MKTIPFIKYTAYGNNFVIVDETALAYLPESEKPQFAERASDVYFGIGSDGLLVIQSCRASVLRQINKVYGYWDTLPVAKDCDFIFRLFESNGKEALACGNGLLCIASYLHQQYGIDSARIMNGIPLARPNVITLGTRSQMGLSWTNLGHPRQAPVEVVSTPSSERCGAQATLISGLDIRFRSYDLEPFTDATTLSLSGYLIFTGEPHLVFFPDECLPREIANTLISSHTTDSHEMRRNFGSWLIDHIGHYINNHYRDRFPVGININFAYVDKTAGTIIYRCYERGINRETLACGTGALAVAYIVKELQLLTGAEITVLPHRCTWYQPNAKLRIEATADGWLLQGTPKRVFEGKCAHIGLSQNNTNGETLRLEKRRTTRERKSDEINKPQAIKTATGTMLCQD